MKVKIQSGLIVKEDEACNKIEEDKVCSKIEGDGMDLLVL